MDELETLLASDSQSWSSRLTTNSSPMQGGSSSSPTQEQNRAYLPQYPELPILRESSFPVVSPPEEMPVRRSWRHEPSPRSPKKKKAKGASSSSVLSQATLASPALKDSEPYAIWHPPQPRDSDVPKPRPWPHKHLTQSIDLDPDAVDTLVSLNREPPFAPSDPIPIPLISSSNRSPELDANPRTIASWDSWRADPGYAPSPPTGTLLITEVQGPSNFGCQNTWDQSIDDDPEQSRVDTEAQFSAPDSE